ncbi:hypothetical protein Vadar_003969 [Vaccinium darrowii]|uniref:Uncharacterized protein n=1 Tax=Vaccinium darrowii TaxID=229202 RepID=A0ACB7YSU8_9ERIC|nr:hypothetical protein Vadar_003969 [Vaccinium darrowii]
MLPLRKTLAQFFQEQPQPPIPTPPSSPTEPQNPSVPDLVQPIAQQLPIPNAQQRQNNLDFPMLVVAFCLTVAIDTAAQSLQNHIVRPLHFHLLCLMVVFAFASIFVAKYISPKYPNAARVLDQAGVSFGVTAFFLAVTTSFPLCLMIISWIIYALSLLAIIICNCPRPLFPN